MTSVVCGVRSHNGVSCVPDNGEDGPERLTVMFVGGGGSDVDDNDNADEDDDADDGIAGSSVGPNDQETDSGNSCSNEYDDSDTGDREDSAQVVLLLAVEDPENTARVSVPALLPG